MKIDDFDTTERVFIIAEIGNNHEGDFALAERLIDLAAKAGVDAVKFQAIVPERLVPADQTARLEQLRRYQFSHSQFELLAEKARACGVRFFATPFDPDTATWLAGFCPVLKIASGDNTYFALLDACARTGRPILLSTGFADLDEVRGSADFVRQRWRDAALDPGLALLHCVAAYPVPAAEANLRAIRALATLGCEVGYSDHTLGVEAAVLSVAAGARVVEKHFTISKTHSEFRDHQLSADPEEMAALVERVREAEQLLGSGIKALSPAEGETVEALRRSAVARDDISAGTILASEHLDWLRPGDGLAPGQESCILGKRLKLALARGQQIAPDHLLDS